MRKEITSLLPTRIFQYSIAQNVGIRITRPDATLYARNGNTGYSSAIFRHKHINHI